MAELPIRLTLARTGQCNMNWHFRASRRIAQHQTLPSPPEEMTQRLTRWLPNLPRHSLQTRTRHTLVGSDSNIFNYKVDLNDDDIPRHSSGSAHGPLSAWPISIKDNICTKDMPTTCSSKMLQSYISPFDATVVELLKAAGAYIVGKTNCDEFGMGSANVNTIFGPVVNPRSREGDEDVRVAGGSSGGAAASVAANFCRV